MKKLVSVLEKCSVEIVLEKLFSRNWVGRNVQQKLRWKKCSVEIVVATNKFLVIPHIDRQFPWLCVIIGLLGWSVVHNNGETQTSPGIV